LLLSSLKGSFSSGLGLSPSGLGSFSSGLGLSPSGIGSFSSGLGSFSSKFIASPSFVPNTIEII